MTSSQSSTDSKAVRRLRLWLLPAYPLLVLAGVVSHRQVFALLALGVVLSAVLLPRLLAGQALAWLSWLGFAAALWFIGRLGFADVLLECLPILINVVLACWFGRSLFGGEPLVARFIIAIEGTARLRERGVASYARHLTWFWTVVLAAQAVVLTVLLLCAVPDGLLMRFGLANPLAIPGRWAALWLHLGCYLLLGAVFLFEYVYRRWHLRHLSHPGLREMLLQLVRHWPQLMRSQHTVVP
jgi:uncharacterized membrane protein